MATASSLNPGLDHVELDRTPSNSAYNVKHGNVKHDNVKHGNVKHGNVKHGMLSVVKVVLGILCSAALRWPLIACLKCVENQRGG